MQKKIMLRDLSLELRWSKFLSVLNLEQSRYQPYLQKLSRAKDTSRYAKRHSVKIHFTTLTETLVGRLLKALGWLKINFESTPPGIDPWRCSKFQREHAVHARVVETSTYVARAAVRAIALKNKKQLEDADSFSNHTINKAKNTFLCC